MFRIEKVRTGNSFLEFREETLTGFRCRINPERLKRGIDTGPVKNLCSDHKLCPFCPENVNKVTPLFSDSSRIHFGESVTFPNLYPFSAYHTVTVITKEHSVSSFSEKQISDAIKGQIKSFEGVEGFPSVNWNCLPSAGASVVHPHLQGLVDARPARFVETYMVSGKRYLERHRKNWYDDMQENERKSERFLFEDEGFFFFANPVPIGEREVRCFLPVSTIDEFWPYIDLFSKCISRIIKCYRQLGTHAFNMSIFFDSNPKTRGYSAFCSIISRINPNPLSISDSSFMERLHCEPVILTIPEEFGRYFHSNF